MGEEKAGLQAIRVHLYTQEIVKSKINNNKTTSGYQFCIGKTETVQSEIQSRVMKPHFAFAVYGTDVSEYKDLSPLNHLTIHCIHNT